MIFYDSRLNVRSNRGQPGRFDWYNAKVDGILHYMCSGAVAAADLDRPGTAREPTPQGPIRGTATGRLPLRPGRVLSEKRGHPRDGVLTADAFPLPRRFFLFDSCFAPHAAHPRVSARARHAARSISAPYHHLCITPVCHSKTRPAYHSKTLPVHDPARTVNLGGTADRAVCELPGHSLRLMDDAYT